MKAILFFVAAGLVLEAHRVTAAAIAEKTGKKVIFRNNVDNEERPEENEGVAGEVPKAFEHFTRYDDAGEIISQGEQPPPPPPGGPLNVLGLPMGCPDNKDALREALDAAGVDYHGNAKIEKLVDLYKDHFYPEA